VKFVLKELIAIERTAVGGSLQRLVSSRLENNIDLQSTLRALGKPNLQQTPRIIRPIVEYPATDKLSHPPAKDSRIRYGRHA
jgi:hypothetical protein